MSEQPMFRREDAPPQPQTAYHEAGHAAMHFYLGLPVKKVTVVPDGDSRGSVHSTKAGLNAFSRAYELGGYGSEHRSRIRLEKEVMALFAGGIAAELLAGAEVGTGTDHDWRVAAFTLDQMTGGNAETEAYLQWLYERTKNTIQNDRLITAGIHALAKELLQRKTLTGKEAYAIYHAGISLEFAALRDKPR